MSEYEEIRQLANASTSHRRNICLRR